jgi:broad specificity phosphatase PhoE
VKSFVVLRHALTRKGRRAADTGSQLSSAGVRSARVLGERLPRFDYAAVGDQARHLETAIALGSPVDEQVSWPSGYVEGVVGHHDQWSWPQPFLRYAELVRLRGGSGLDGMVRQHLGHWRRILGSLPEGGAGLVVSSGGSIEPVLVAALPEADHEAWGSAFHHLEGAALRWDGTGFGLLQLLRHDPEPTAQGIRYDPTSLSGSRTCR